ncbi:MAG: T9SS type A sorting domain-containing protein [Candidatus Marinimicrobia bacterium]|nr:T9SS type A sorting domain-containing protein [Candidatus Neomarinimicrobiota bacterium]
MCWRPGKCLLFFKRSCPNYFDDLHPNPFNPITTIKYSLPEAGSVQLLILNILGQEIMKLQNEVQAPGNYEVQWNGLDQTGKPVDTGVYFARLEAGNYSETIKMVYLK